MATTATNSNMKYSLNKFQETIFYGFEFTIPDKTVALINELASQVGSQTFVRNTVFSKKELEEGVVFGQMGASSNFRLGGGGGANRRRRGNKNMESNNDDWESLRTFQATKILEKSGFDLHIDSLRSLLNKISDKTYLDIQEKIVLKMDEVLAETDFDEEVGNKVSIAFYDIAANNKFFSKIYADLYANIATKYPFMKTHFNSKYATFIDDFKNMTFVDAKVNYDLFCEANKLNENRKANTQFFVNLASNGFLEKKLVVMNLKDLLELVMSMINQTEKKNEVDEITENVAILYKKDLIDAVLDDPDCDEEEYEVSGDSIADTVTILARSKAKDFKSLSNKSIFKYMDLVEM
jgi:CRISPR/Cas system-associated protein endoribonuclease Cas2